jgi:hypothetical protein
MKALLLLTIASSTAWAGDQGGRPDTPSNVRREARGDESALTLGVDQLQRYAAVYLPEVRACYVEQTRGVKRATGELSLELIVHRDGSVVKVAVVAPGVTGTAYRRLDACVREQVATWHFPVRRGFTDAILPYLFIQAKVPANAWPGCWSPKGCKPEPALQTARR